MGNVYIKRINGIDYYYWQESRTGRSPFTRYIGPVNPKRRAKVVQAIVDVLTPPDEEERTQIAVDRAEARYPAVEAEPKRAVVDPVPVEKPAPTMNLATPAEAPAESQGEAPADEPKA